MSRSIVDVLLARVVSRSIVDVLLAPFLYRANVVVESVLGVTLAGNPDLPHFTKYLEAITTMPAYR